MSVLAELIEAPDDPSLAAAAAAAQAAADAVAAAPPTRGARAGLSAVERARGQPNEGLPHGVLMRFVIIRGDTREGECDPTPLPGCEAHFSLRRCLLAYFASLTPHDLCTAMGMSVPNFNTAQPTASGVLAQQFHFIPLNPLTLLTQQTVRHTLTLMRPMVFC